MRDGVPASGAEQAGQTADQTNVKDHKVKVESVCDAHCTHAPENVSLKLARPSMLLFYMRHLAWPSGWILVGAMCEAHEKDTRAAEARDTAPTEVGHTDSAYTVWPKL